MPNKLSEKDSLALYFLKSYAILLSVAGHVSVMDLSTPLNAYATRLWDMYSNTSVVAFFIIGGILYTRKEGDSLVFWKKKLTGMIIPWLFCGTFSFAYRALYVDVSWLELGNWLIGNGTWLYYVTMYLTMLLIFKPLWKSEIALWACVAITAVQITLKTFGLGVPSPLGSDYLNPLHWIGYFALGILLRRRNLQISKGFFVLCGVVFVLSSYWVHVQWIYNFFHIANPLLTVSTFFILLPVGRKLGSGKLKGVFREIGSSTYCIYLLHGMFVPPVLRRIPWLEFKSIFAPFLGMIIMMVLIEIGKFIANKLPFGDKLRMLVGLR